ncbi:MAG: nucleotidyltransferase domain-containing protein [Candidatus Peregrinibacteria bacterium]
MNISPFDLQPQHLLLIQDILRKHVPHCTVWAFGSRTQGKAKPTSDLDLAIAGPEFLDLKIMDALQEELERSTLPMKVDIVDWNRAAPSFQKIIERQKMVIQD